MGDVRPMIPPSNTETTHVETEAALTALKYADIVCVLGPGEGTLPGTSPAALSFNPHTVAELEAIMRDTFSTYTKRVVLAFDERVPEEDRARARQVMEDRQHAARMSQNTIDGKTVMQGRNVLRNLHRLGRHGIATTIGEPLKGVPVFLVAAGPSLERNRDLLEKARGKGAIFTVNTASAAIPCEVDVIVSVESLDVSQALRKKPRDCMHVLDIHAAPGNWDAAAEAGPCAATFPLDPPVNWLALALGAIPIVSGCAAATTAYSLAMHWGASEIVFVGQDCAWSDAGPAYAKGTVYEDITVDRDGNRMNFGGQSKQILSQHVCEVEAYGGDGVRRTSYAMEGQIAWFGCAARHFPTTNATEGGARIPNTTERPLADVLADLPDIPRPVIPVPNAVPNWQAARDRILWDARAIMTGDHSLSQAQRRLPLLSLWVLPAIIRMQSGPPMLPDEYHARVMAAVKDAAADVIKTLEAE